MITCPKCSSEDKQNAITLQTISTKTGKEFKLYKCTTTGCGLSIPASFFNVAITEDEAQLLLDDFVEKAKAKTTLEQRTGVITKDGVRFPKNPNQTCSVELFLHKEQKKDSKFANYLLSMPPKNNQFDDRL